jgi:ATP-dependent RNA helicase HelY
MSPLAQSNERAATFAAGLPFSLDPFQVQAMESVAGGSSVLVAAPTGSGKTVVAEFACWLAIDGGGKCFYTAPIKALSNQKFRDLGAQHGAAKVGLLTGDNAINGEAPLVVMTTEVLRNMLYESSGTLEGLRWVVMDEVHYLQDPYRGAVWEEVLIHLPSDVSVVCLSATVSNVEEFGDWLRTLRGATDVVVERTRPVELRNLVMVGKQLYPLLGEHGRPSGDLARRWRTGTAAASRYRRPPPGRSRRREGGSTYTPSRVEVVDQLQARDKLPAIVFIFSRAGCDGAVESCIRAGVDLTSPVEAERITEVAETKAASLEEGDLQALEFPAFLEGLQRGVAAHHAGMLPVFKETVEELFAAGYVKVVFATETLSLGINMPARTVVIENLSKFTGEKHELLTPVEYTQLVGRAGRRGMDELGFGVTLFTPWVSLDKLASLATVRAYTLRSSLRPSYNMAVNVVRNHDYEQAAHQLISSLAKFVTDRRVVEWEKGLEDLERQTTELRDEVQCECGDVVEYAELRRAAEEAVGSEANAQEVRKALVQLSPGDVVWGRSLGKALVLEQARVGKTGAPRITAMGVDRKLRKLGPRDFSQPPEAVAQIRLRGHSWRSPKARKGLAGELRGMRIPRPKKPPARKEHQRLVEAYESHPSHECPKVSEHVQSARRLAETEAEATRLRKLARRRQGTIARTFERVLGVLSTLGYTDGWALTEKGELLRRVYNESDLLVVECLSRGWLDDLQPDELASVATLFVYESRRRDDDEGAPNPGLAQRERKVRDLYRQIRGTERQHEVELLKEPDPGFMAQMYEWAGGGSLESVLDDRATTAGDFVRSAKQTLDLLQQLRAAVDPREELHLNLSGAVDRVQRGVVAYSSVG